jgi:hypothetical protein
VSSQSPHLKIDESISAPSLSTSTSTPSKKLKHNTEFVAECDLPTQYGTFKLRGYRDGLGKEPTVVMLGDVSGEDVIVRVHDQV